MTIFSKAYSGESEIKRENEDAEVVSAGCQDYMLVTEVQEQI